MEKTPTTRRVTGLRRLNIGGNPNKVMEPTSFTAPQFVKPLAYSAPVRTAIVSTKQREAQQSTRQVSYKPQERGRVIR